MRIAKKLITKTMVQRFARDVSGATLVEYGIALLVVIIVGGATLGALANR